MITYPIAIPSGSNILPYVSGSNNIGSTSKPIATIYSNTFSGNTGNITNLNSTTINATNISGNAIVAGSLSVSGSLSVAGVSYIGFSNLATINFGSTPVNSASFTIANPSVTASNNIIVSPSATATAGRTADDWWWDSIIFSAFASTGQVNIYAKTENGCSIMGTRNILYTIT